MTRDRIAGTRRLAAIWALAGIALLAFAPRVWRRGSPARLFSLAETPIDRSSPDGAAQWVFLSESLKHLPRGASYTIRANTGDEEMNLFMMSLGLYEGHFPYPNSYFGVRIPGYAAKADFVLAYRCAGDRADASEIVARVRGGCVQRVAKKTR